VKEKKTLKYSISGDSREIPTNKKKTKEVAPEKALNIEEMMDSPERSNLLDFMVLMEGFKKDMAYKYLLERNTNEIKRLIRVGPNKALGENWDIIGGRLQGILDSFEGAVKGTIITGKMLKEKVKAEARAKKGEKDFEGIDNSEL